ncbi:MAG TPA: Gfo/Idh/MocA family oxidoreductase [Aestuariivirgaceae bacterium]|nr:Gfo/Idh/MocA family oxidoreductase [Aestuariivirgaceae bacterium]
MQRTRIALVGLGLAVAPHARSLLDLAERVEVVWAATRSRKRADAFYDAYGFPVTTDVEAAVSDPSVEAVFVLTPPNAHAEVALAALAHGKHVLLEKPLDASLDRARKIVETAEGLKLVLGVVLQHRFREAALRLTEIIAAGGLGRIEMASVTVPWWRPQSYYDEPGRGTLARDGGGVLITQAIHPLDLFRSLVDPVEVVAAQTATTGLHRMESEDYAAALVRVAGGAPGSIIATTAFYPGDPERIEIAGTLGSARIVGNRLDVRYLSGETEEVGAHAGSGGGADPMDFAPDAHCRLIVDFLDAIAEGRPPKASGREALRSQVLIEAILGKAAAAR